jgi:hypothetical protein
LGEGLGVRARFMKAQSMPVRSISEINKGHGLDKP